MTSKFYNPDIAALLLRIIFGGVMLINHGWGKFQKLTNGDLGFADPIGFGPEISLYLTVFAEVLCAGLVLVGMFTRTASFILLFTMAIAFFVVHGGDAFPDKEPAFMYMLGYAAIIFLGPGKFSFDRAFRKKL